MMVKMIVFTVPAVVTALMATFGFCSNMPPTPPSASAHVDSEPFFQGVKQVRESWHILFLVIEYSNI